MKIQDARDDEGPYFRVNQKKPIDNDLQCSSNEFSNQLALLTMLLAQLSQNCKCFNLSQSLLPIDIQ